MKKLPVLCCLVLFSPGWAPASDASNFEEHLEEVYRHCTEEVPYEVLGERLWERFQDPLELNRATRAGLQALGILTEEQLDHFFMHIAKTGPLLAIYELQAIPGFDLPTIRRLVPFVKVVDTDYHHRAFWPQGLGARDSYGLLRYERVLETRQGYLPGKKNGQVPYAGSPDGFLARLRIQQPSGWGLGVTSRVKAGEAFAWDVATHRYGGSLQRFHWVLKDRKSLQKLVVGDYAVGYGEGLVLHAGFAMNKSSETMKVIRTNNLGVRPHTALTNAAFRGVATTWQWELVEFTIYGSMADLDGKLQQDAAGNQYVATIARGGGYRTESELAKKGQVKEQVIGSTLVYKSATPGAMVGINALYSHYSLPVHPNPRQGNPLRFRGQDHVNASLFCRYLWQNLHFFGEGGLSKKGAPAAVAGVVASLSRYVDATVLGRYYGQAFHAPYGNAFRENSTGNSNERGVYLGARIKPWQRWYLDAYYDYFYFPWFKGQARDGHSWLAKVTHQPRRDMLLYFQYKGKVKPRKMPKKPHIEDGTKHHYKLRYHHQLSRVVGVNTEVQGSGYHWLNKVTRGYAAVQDVVYKIRQLQLKGRVAWFSTDDWDNRLAFYEPNVLYSGFNFPPYYGRGMKYCLVVCYKPTPAFRLEMKYALTHYRDRHQIGSGGEAIAGNVKNEVRLQAMFRF